MVNITSFSSDDFGSLVNTFPPANWTNLASSFLEGWWLGDRPLKKNSQPSNSLGVCSETNI